MKTVKRLYAPLRAKQRIGPEKGRTGLEEWRLRRKDGGPAGKNRQTGPARRGRQGVCNRRAGRPEGPRAAPQAALETAPETARAETPARGERPGSDSPRPARPDTGNAPCRGRGKNKNGRRRRRRREKTEMQEPGQKQGESAGPCAWRYSHRAEGLQERTSNILATLDRMEGDSGTLKGYFARNETVADAGGIAEDMGLEFIRTLTGDELRNMCRGRLDGSVRVARQGCHRVTGRGKAHQHGR